MNPRAFKRINYALAGTLLASGVTLEKIVPQVGAKNANSLRVGLAKRGVTAGMARAQVFEQDVPQSVTLKLARAAASVLRDSVHATTLEAANNLREIKTGKSLKKLKAVVDVLEPLSRVGDRLENWSGSQDGGLHINFIESPFMPQPVVAQALPSVTPEPVIELETTQDTLPSTT